MKRIKLLSWNVNGLRAVYRKGFLGWFRAIQPDILCVQETKASEKQLPEELKNIDGYCAYYTAAEKKGYSGVGLFTRIKPENIKKGLGIRKYDVEGRVVVADYGAFVLFNVYFPNGKISKDRLRYKMAFYDEFLGCVDKLRRKGTKLIICGDVNTAHKEIDLARPRENERISGFLPEERAWIDKLLAHGFIDTFRVFNTESGQYTWWDLKTRARERNVGWRIDYSFITENLRKNLKAAFILKDVMGSDHCPIGIEIAI
ncbi:exodeoxyribonuclease III [candidate division WOR_3 bacterium SM1_77]|jgi:exodeoxyribonuclease-3|uniref:Exodeoxyribonuclease III n=1 Tax=candidate division WOR_3 bacterium SM1_77 TaxID=1703778 RepID=A0A0S8K015_UNCW3|nr:MAG: exodeoxyribonuclease III [candidate division WOR_3 bacterium SM1_77]